MHSGSIEPNRRTQCNKSRAGSGVCMVCGDQLSINSTPRSPCPSSRRRMPSVPFGAPPQAANLVPGSDLLFFQRHNLHGSASLRNVLPSFHTLPHREMARSPCTVTPFDLQLTSRDQGVFQKTTPDQMQRRTHLTTLENFR